VKGTTEISYKNCPGFHPFSRRAGRNISARIKRRIDSMANPAIRKGKRMIQTIGYSNNAMRARGQHKTRRINHNKNAIIKETLRCSLNRTLFPPIRFQYSGCMKFVILLHSNAVRYKVAKITLFSRNDRNSRNLSSPSLLVLNRIPTK
jgi:hypothetical protein